MRVARLENRPLDFLAELDAASDGSGSFAESESYISYIRIRNNQTPLYVEVTANKVNYFGSFDSAEITNAQN